MDGSLKHRLIIILSCLGCVFLACSEKSEGTSSGQQAGCSSDHIVRILKFVGCNLIQMLNNINMSLIDHLDYKYRGTKYERDIHFLKTNYLKNGGNLKENYPDSTINTSYVLNKGEEIRICLRDKKNAGIHDVNTMIFVNLHELSHMLDFNYGHKKSFWTKFKFLLCEAVKLGYYTPVDYSKSPTTYCGLTIRSNPYFTNNFKCITSCKNGKCV